MNYLNIIKELTKLTTDGIQKWFDASSDTCYTTLYDGNGVIICHYLYDDQPSASFYYLNDMGYRTEKGFDVKNGEAGFEEIVSLHKLALEKFPMTSY